MKNLGRRTKSKDSLNFALETAKAAAQEAGKYLVGKLGSAHALYKKSLHDDLLDVDLAAEAIILKKLGKNFPGAGILSEEAGETRQDTGCQWIIDPLDGSANFQHGNPAFGISIGFRVNNVTTLGIIYLPMYDEMFTAVLGHSASLNDHPINVSNTSSLDEAIIMMGDFMRDGNFSVDDRHIATIAQLAQAVKRVRMIGTAAADFAYVASGRADALVMFRAPPWDFEVGHLLVTEAGGEVSVMKDKQGKVLAIYSNGAIHQQLVELLSV